jgi:hypothetical protein
MEQSARTTVFGLDVHCAATLPFLQTSRAASTGRALELTLADEDDLALSGWRGEGEIVCDEREPDGTVNFRIEAHPEAGYLIWGPTYGRHVLSRDGRRLWCLPGDCAEESWQRLLVAQVLPFAALLRGLEVLHAGAVVKDGEAVAFLGPSGAGKTSLAVELCLLGSTFLADDVLALERSGTRLQGHPGTPVAGIHRAEAGPARYLTALEAIAENDRERIVRMEGAEGPAPLGALFFLDRRPDGPARPHFEPTTDPQLLLASTFNSVLTASERLVGLLDICALAARQRVERVVAGPGVDATRLAEAIARRLAAST